MLFQPTHSTLVLHLEPPHSLSTAHSNFIQYKFRFVFLIARCFWNEIFSQFLRKLISKKFPKRSEWTFPLMFLSNSVSVKKRWWEEEKSGWRKKICFMENFSIIIINVCWWAMKSVMRSKGRRNIFPKKSEGKSIIFVSYEHEYFNDGYLFSFSKSSFIVLLLLVVERWLMVENLKMSVEESFRVNGVERERG